MVEQTTKINNNKNGIKKYTFLPLLLLLSAIFVSYSTQRFRYSEYRWIYHAGWVSCYILHLVAFVASIITSSLILIEMKTGIKNKLLWLLLSLLPVVFWVVMFLFIILEVSF